MTEPREHILVADDEPAVLEVCLRVLRRNGYTADGVPDGQTALERFAKAEYDLVLSDIKMPDVDGLQVLRQVKAINPETPVVLITGYGNLETSLQALRYGAGGLVLKPFHAADLLHAVEEALAKTRLLRENVRLKTLLPLLEAGQCLMGQTDEGQIQELIVELANRLAQADVAYLCLCDENGRVRESARSGRDDPLGLTALGYLTKTLGRWKEDEEPELSDEIRSGLGFSHVLLAPIIFHDAPQGCLLLGRPEEHGRFEEGSREAVGAFVRHASAALENARLFRQIRAYADGLEERVQERTRELRESEARVRQLYETSRQLRISLDLDQVMGDMLALAMSAAGALYGSLLVPDGKGGELERVSDGGMAAINFSGNDLERDLCQRVLEAGAPISLSDLGQTRAAASSALSGSVLGLPLLLEDHVEAVLILGHHEPHAFSAQDIELLLPICARAAALIANARQFRQTSERLNQAYLELSQRADQLEMTTQQLMRADKLAAIGQLAAGISHEMGNIIAPLQVYADLLAGAKPGESDYDNYVEQIQRITERARTILRQFTDFARKDKGHAEPVDLRSVVGQCLQLMDYTLTRKGIRVKKDLPGDLPPVLIDPGQLEQVFVNIVVNAIDAMPQGGDLLITAQAHRSSQRRDGSGYVQMCFQDSGVGIDPADLGHVFEPFFTTKEAGKGTGLGLFICYGIIERYDGTIDIASEQGKGTMLTIRLPFSPQDGHPPSLTEEAPRDGR